MAYFTNSQGYLFLCSDIPFEVVQKVKQKRAFLFRALSLVNLAPDIIETILNGIQPSHKATAGQEEPASLTLSKLRKGFLEDWDEQRKLFGMK